MADTIPKHGVIDYPASALREFFCYGYEWLDNLHFIRRRSFYRCLRSSSIGTSRVPVSALRRQVGMGTERLGYCGCHHLFFLSTLRFIGLG
jgi:hypothetical protein